MHEVLNKRAYMTNVLLYAIPANWAVALVLHVKTLRQNTARPAKAELVMYVAIMTFVGVLVGLYLACRFLVTFFFDWSDRHR